LQLNFASTVSQIIVPIFRTCKQSFEAWYHESSRSRWDSFHVGREKREAVPQPVEYPDGDGGAQGVSDMKQVWTLRTDVAAKDLEAYVAWLQQIPWQIFGTFTFAWAVSDPQALRVFGEFVNRMEKSASGSLAFVRGDEKRFSGCGMPGAPRHYHAVFAAHRKLDRHWVADHWMSLAGRRDDGTGADVRIYDPNLNGLAYVLKFINQPLGDWDLRNLDLFLRPLDQQHMDSRQRRRLARHAARLQPHSPK
jgi:hypothetical protein